jgi:hypothetical protein
MLCFDKSTFISPEKAEQMTCSICNGIFRDPIIDPCGHIFGRSCFLEFINQNSKCPISMNTIDKETNIMPCNPVRNFVSKLQIKCPHASDCHWTGILDSLDQHLTLECGSELMVCPNLECEYKVIRKNFESTHKDSCVHRMDECHNCNKTIQFNQISKHMIDCYKNNIKCPQNCLKVFNREELANHMAKECEMRIISCEMKEAGCTYSGNLKNVTEHHTSPTVYASHLNLIASSSQNTSNDLSLLPKVHNKFDIMTQRFVDISKSLSDQRVVISDLSNKVDEIKAEIQKRDTENSLKLDELKEWAEKSIISNAQNTKRDIDMKFLDMNKEIEKKFNQSLEQLSLRFEVQFSLLKSEITKVTTEKETSTIDLYFDEDCKSKRISLRNSNEAVYKVNRFLYLFAGNIGVYCLLHNQIVPNIRYKFYVQKQYDRKMAIGICSKPFLRKYNFEIWTNNWSDRYLFFADGDYQVMGSTENFKNSGSHMTFRSRDTIELVFDSDSQKLICRNLTTKSITQIEIKSTDSMSAMFPCILLQQRKESIKLI